MRNLILGLALSVAFIVGCLVRPLVIPPVRAGTNPAKWEYKCFRDSDLDDVEAKSNKLGRAGFEMTTVSTAHEYCFKRRLP